MHRRLALFFCLLPALAAQAQPASLADCRSLRHAPSEQAWATCTAALDRAVDADQRFELRMHLADLAVAAGDWPAATTQLDQAEALLPAVTDPLGGHRLQRRRGMLAYRRDDPAHALAAFLNALEFARRAGDRAAEAISENDLGTVYRRLGEDREALDHWLRSLDMKRAAGAEDLAATEANLGALYLDLGEPAQARRFLTSAEQSHLRFDRPLQAAHTRESIASLLQRQGDYARAREILESVWAQFEAVAAVPDQLRVSLHLARLALDGDRPADAPTWLARARSLAGSSAPLELQVLYSRWQRLSGAAEAAYVGLQKRLPWPTDAAAAIRIEAWRELAEASAASGRASAALEQLKQAERLAGEVARERHGEQMNALRVRFELAQVEQERIRLQHENAAQQLLLETRRRQLLSLAVAALAVLGLTTISFQRRFYRHRLAAQQREAEHRSRAERALREADALRADLRSMQDTLDRSTEAVFVVDAGGRVRSASRGALDLVRRPRAEVIGSRLEEVFGADAAARLDAARDVVAVAAENGEDAATTELALDLPIDGAPRNLRVEVRGLSLEEELSVLTLAAGNPREPWAAALSPTEPTTSAEQSGDGFRHALVQLMQNCLEAWERATRSSRIELAERSGVWRVTVDDGRLRTRTLDRYLSIDTLPAHPRWREAVRTAYYVLAECPLDDAHRIALERLLEGVLESTRKV